MKKKIWILTISFILITLILTFSGSIIAKGVLFIEIELEDGSIIMGKIQSPLTISIEIKQRKIDIKMEDIFSIVKGEITLKDGSILEGIVEIKQVIVRSTWYDKLEIEGKYINSIWVLTKSLTAAPVSGGVIWSLQSPLILFATSTGLGVKGTQEFWREISKTIETTIWVHPSFTERAEERSEQLKKCNTIFLIHSKNLTELHKLAIKYPELLPLRYAELKRYPFPLIYFSRDARTDIVRGIIVADEIDGSWVKSLVEKELPLDKPLRYEDRQLKKIETK